MPADNDISAVYDEYADMMFKIAYLYMGNKDDAEDALQDVFLKLITKNPTFKDSEHKKAWLIRTTQNKCKDMLRSSHRKNESLDSVSISSQQSNSDTHIDITDKLIHLDAKYKSVIILYYYYDFSVSEIAKTLKLSNSGVKMRLKRGREILKIELEDYRNER